MRKQKNNTDKNENMQILGFGRKVDAAIKYKLKIICTFGENYYRNKVKNTHIVA